MVDKEKFAILTTVLKEIYIENGLTVNENLEEEFAARLSRAGLLDL